MGAAAYGGKGLKGRGKGKWRGANRRRQLQTATQPGAMRTPLVNGTGNSPSAGQPTLE